MPSVDLHPGKPILAPHGKLLVAQAMFYKGKNFLASAELLKQHNGDGVVVLHLIGQGLEIIQKALLLKLDYDKYYPLLRKIGHDLIKGSDTFTEAYGFRTISGPTRKEFELLSGLFSRHILRYGSILDLFGDTSAIAHELIRYRAVALCRYGDQSFTKQKMQNKSQ